MNAALRRCRLAPLLTAVLIAVLTAVPTSVISAAEPAPAYLGDWKFRARLDGRPIGEHRFTVTADGEGRKVVSTASFDVKLLMFTAYRYRHQGTEHWRAGCLQSLVARTDDDGKTSQVQIEPAGEALAVSTPDGNSRLTGCVMSYAYWNPGIRTQSSLLNAQTGHYESVHVSEAGSGSIDVHGQRVDALKYRITGESPPIDVWYSPAGVWLGLDATVKGDHLLTYRLE